MSPSQVQGSTQQPVWPAPKEPPVVPHGLEEQDPGGLCGGRTPAGRLAAPGSPGPACLCSPAFLPPPPPSFLMGPGVAPGERVCWYDGSGRGLCPLLRDRAGRLCGQASATEEVFRLLEKSQLFYQQIDLHTGITDSCNSGQESHSKNCKHIQETKGKMLLYREKEAVEGAAMKKVHRRNVVSRVVMVSVV